MPLDEQMTGSPPAVTAEMLVSWRKLAEDVAAAMAVGGEQGLTVLRNLMPEWCEAADDVNLAREICINLAAEGRREEALEWHAEGFFDAADLLTPERPGWEEWADALISRGVPIPAVSQQLKDLADRVHEELLVQDLEGKSLTDYLSELRSNILAKGSQGERLTIIETIRRFDPNGVIWREMAAPIRKKRAGEIARELVAAVSAQDFVLAAMLTREVNATTWEDGLPADLQILLPAIENWRIARELVPRLTAAASKLVDKCEVLDQIMRAGGAEQLDLNTALDQAKAQKTKFLEVRQKLSDAISVANRSGHVARALKQNRLEEQIRAAEQTAMPWIEIIDQARDYWKWLNRFRELQTAVDEMARNAPVSGGNWDEAKARCGRWLQRSAELAAKCRHLRERAPVPPPRTFVEELERLDRQEACVRERIAQIARLERYIVVGVLTGLGVVVLSFVGLIAFMQR